jgi:hypothetical protein
MTRTTLWSLAAAALLAMAAGGAVPADAAKLKKGNKATTASSTQKKLKAQAPGKKGATWDQWRKAMKDAGCAIPTICQ